MGSEFGMRSSIYNRFDNRLLPIFELLQAEIAGPECLIFVLLRHLGADCAFTGVASSGFKGIMKPLLE